MSITLDLINAIQAGDSTGIEQHFDYLMTSRIAERLDDMRVEVAKNMFKEEVEELDEQTWYVYDHDDEKKKIKKQLKTHSVAKLHAKKLGGNHKVASSEYYHDNLRQKTNEDFEDITPEDIEEFMQTEDFEQLDEISKESLRSYMDKSVQSYSDTGTKLRAKLQQGEEDPKLRKKILNRLQGQMTAYNKMKKA